MRKFLIILLSLITNFLNAQTIKGSVEDENGSVLRSATVSLVKATDSSLVKLAVTDNSGQYVFSEIKGGNYRVMVSNVGFKNSFSSLFEYADKDLSVPVVKMNRIPSNLSTVTVTARKAMVEVRADKMVLNVEGTVNATGSNALELLRKSPGVLLDRDENISLAGKNGVQVYIDGKPTPLTSQDLAGYLKTIQSSQIEAIELITNPSAKYDAAGNAGIINIRLVKNKSHGTNGSVNAGWNIATFAKYNAGFSLNHRSAHLNLFGTYNFSYMPNEQNVRTRRTVLDSLFDQTATIFDLRKAHNYKMGADYFLDKTNTLGIMVNGIIADPTSKTSSKSFISKQGASTPDRVLQAGNFNDMQRDNLNLNLNYSYNDGKGRSMTANLDRGNYNYTSDQMQSNHYYNLSGQILPGSIIYHMVSPSKIEINSFKGDYEQNLLSGKLGLGVKSAWIRTDNDFQRYNVNGGSEDFDEERSNLFIYKEKINAGYMNYNRALKGMNIQVGLRVENTVSEGKSNGLKKSGSGYVDTMWAFRRPYTDFFPSAAITFNKNPLKQWNFTYSRRIDRPSYKDLNPFEFKLDEYTFIKGNTDLRPQYTNSFGVSHTYKYKLNISANYSHVKNMIVSLFDTLERSKAFVTKKNLATQDIISFNVNYPFQYKSYSVFTNISASYSQYNADFGPGRTVALEAFGFNILMQHSLKFKKTWTAELSGFYNAPTVTQGSFQSKSIYNVDAGVSKQILKGRGTVKASVSDIFYTMKFRATSEFAGQVMKLNVAQESRQFKISFNVRFGNNGVKPARQRNSGVEEETKRVQGS